MNDGKMNPEDFNRVSLSLLDGMRKPQVTQIGPMSMLDSGISIVAVADNGINVCDEPALALGKAAHSGISIDNVDDSGVTLDKASIIKNYDSLFELPVQDLPILSEGTLRGLDGRKDIDSVQPVVSNNILKFLAGPSNG